MHPQDRVGADLGHDREERGDRGGCIRVGRGQPELNGEKCGFDRKDHHQKDRRDTDDRGFFGRDFGNTRGEVSDIERAG